MEDGEGRCSESLPLHEDEDAIDTPIQTALLYLVLHEYGNTFFAACG